MKKFISIMISIFVLFSHINSLAVDNKFTRGSFCSRIVELLEIEYDVTGIPEIFDDVSVGDEHYDAIIAMYMLKYMNGYDDRTFQQSKPITNGEVAKIIVDMIFGNFNIPDDVELGNEWYAEYAWKAKDAGLMPNVQDWDADATENDINIDEIKKYAPLKLFTEANGICGENLTWELTDKGILTIKGTGNMDNYSGVSSAPWHDKRVLSLTIENGVTSIGDYAFSIPSLLKATLPHSIESLGKYSFYGSAISEITIPENVIYIGNRAFSCCYNLKNIYVESGNLKYYDIDGVLCNKEEKAILCFPSGKNTVKYEVLDDVAKIADNAFEYCNKLETVILNGNVKYIGVSAFRGCNRLSKVLLGESLNELSRFAFIGCDSLKNISIPESVVRVDDSAFFGCDKLETISVSELNTKYCDIEGVLFSKDKKTLMCFPPAKDTEYYIVPEEVTKIAAQSFAHCTNLKNVEFSPNLNVICSNAFDLCSGLISINIPGNVKEIQDTAFSGCVNLNEVVISEGTTTIGHAAFEDCSKLKKVHIPKSVNKIGEDAFADGFTKEVKCIIYGFADTYAKKYSYLNNIPFVEMAENVSVEMKQENGNIICDVTLPVTAENENSTVFIASYNEDGRMLKCNYNNVELDSSTPVMIEKSKDAVMVKIFVWGNSNIASTFGVTYIYL